MKIRWLGHAGFKLQFEDPSDNSVTRTIYIDVWPDCPTFPENAKAELNDADLILVTHGHFDLSAGAPDLYKNAVENGKSPKIVAASELFHFFKEFYNVPEEAKIAMVPADHSSACICPEGKLHLAGPPLGFFIEAAGKKLYHAGDTAVFSDMEIISDYYEPEYALLPIGGLATMGPKEAAYALAKYLKSVKKVIPMHFGTFPLLAGTPEQLKEHFANYQIKYDREDVTFIDPFSFL